MQLHCTNHTTPQLQLHHYTATTAALHHSTSRSCGWGDRPGDHYNRCNHSKNITPSTFKSIGGIALPSVIHNNQPLLQVSYSEASTAALCGTASKKSLSQRSPDLFLLRDLLRGKPLGAWKTPVQSSRNRYIRCNASRCITLRTLARLALFRKCIERFQKKMERKRSALKLQRAWSIVKQTSKTCGIPWHHLAIELRHHSWSSYVEKTQLTQAAGGFCAEQGTSEDQTHFQLHEIAVKLEAIFFVLPNVVFIRTQRQTVWCIMFWICSGDFYCILIIS